jgi:hypothetical protein
MNLAEWWPWALLVSIAVTALVALLYRRPDLKVGWRVVFVLLRGCALALLALLFADLACQTRRSLESPAAALVLDDSASMSLADPEGRSRSRYAEELGEGIRAAHPELDWTVYDLDGLSAVDPLEAVRALASRRPDLAAVVVVGDGGGGVPVAELGLPFPVHAAVAGGASLFDVALDAPRGPRLVLAGRTALFQLDVRLNGDGPSDAAVLAKAGEVFGEGREVELDPAEVDLSTGGGVAEFRFTPPREGWWLLVFETPPLPGEATPANNARRLLVNVRREGMTSLVLAGELGPESSFLQRSLQRLPGVEAELLYRRPDGYFYDADGDRRTPDLTSPDALLLVDLVPRGAVLAGVSDRVARGLGVGLILGSPGLRVASDDALWKVMPALRQGADLRLVEGQSRAVQVAGQTFGGLVGADLPTLLTYPEGLRVGGQTSLVLVNPAGKRVPGALLASSGAPRALLLGRGWWRWSLSAGNGAEDDHYDTLVADLFAYLSTPATGDRLTLTLDRRRSTAGGPVNVDVTGGGEGEPRCAVFGFGGAEESEVGLSRLGEGRWRGGFTLEEVGTYVVRAELGNQHAEEPLVVEPDFSEFADLVPNGSSLALLATLGGGRLLSDPTDELPLGPGAALEVYGRKPLRANPWLLGVLIVLIAGEWFLRRRQNLR